MLRLLVLAWETLAETDPQLLRERRDLLVNSMTLIGGINLMPQFLILILGSCLLIKLFLLARGVYDMDVMVSEFPSDPAVPIFLTVFPAIIFTNSYFLWNIFIRRLEP